MKKPRKNRRYSISLSPTEMRRLTVYAATAGIDRPSALHRIVADALRQCATAAPPPDKRQLGLFDSVQIDIFNNTSKTTNTNE